VRSIKERVNEISDDPKKLKRTFAFIWIVAYAMLIMGFLLMIWVFFYT